MSATPRYILSGIPNDEAGKAFVAQLRKHFNRERYELTVRGSGPRKHHEYSTPLSKATSMRVYIEDKLEDDQLLTRCNAHANRIDTLTHIRRQLEAENETLTRNVQDLQAVQDSLLTNSNLAYSRGYNTMQKKVVAWLEGMPWWLRKAIFYFYTEV